MRIRNKFVTFKAVDICCYIFVALYSKQILQAFSRNIVKKYFVAIFKLFIKISRDLDEHISLTVRKGFPKVGRIALKGAILVS